MNLVSLLRDRAVMHPKRLALIDRKHGGDRLLTFEALWRKVECGSGYLQACGLKAGDTILLFQPVSIELYELLLAALHGGMRVMLADPANGAAFLQRCCERVPPACFFGPWKAQLLRWWVPGLRAIPRAITGGWFAGASSWQTDGDPAAMAAVDDDAPALITFTSGSTGQPKAAVRTHGFLLAQHAALADSLRFEDGEVDLVTLPVFVLANLASGLTSVLADTDLRHPGQADAAAIRRQCAAHGVTRCAASPAFFEALLKGGDAPHGMPSFAKVFTGGAPVFPDLLERLCKRLPEAEVSAVFGSTEAEPMAHLEAGHYDDSRLALTAAGRGLYTGHPVSQVRLRVVKDQFGTAVKSLTAAELDALTLQPGEVGEIVVSGNHVLSGYLDGVGDEETKIRVGDHIWHRTGDAGWLDEQGGLWLCGRCTAKLGDSVYPFSIECALRVKHPNWRTAALKHRDACLLVVEGKPDAAEWRAMERKAAELGIDRLVTVESLPLDRRHQAKVDYPALKVLLDGRMKTALRQF